MSGLIAVVSDPAGVGDIPIEPNCFVCPRQSGPLRTAAQNCVMRAIVHRARSIL